MSDAVALDHMTVAYGAVRAVDDLTLRIRKGELLAMLGPSGCGKTTTLRTIAGFVRATGGTIRIGGRDVTRVPPHRRGTGMVFQSYALFPHLSVRENIAFGLRRRRVPRAEIAERVQRIMGLLRLDGLADRLPRQLSGGQQQRVAVGRALVINPSVILLDEPFSNLDAQLRETTRVELRRIQQELGLTALFVTHDQVEAMAIADRVAVMNQGRLVQLDRPELVYSRPATRFVATFIGRANLLSLAGAVPDGADTLMRTTSGLELHAKGRHGATDIVVLRPEAIRLESPDIAGPNTVGAIVAAVSFLGPIGQVSTILQDGSTLVVEVPGEVALGLRPEMRIGLSWPAKALTVVRE